MPTLSAATLSNPWLKAFYARLIARGKPHKVALIAAMRKLLGAIYSVAKHRRPLCQSLTAQHPLPSRRLQPVKKLDQHQPRAVAHSLTRTPIR